ncbi:MAG TPA: inositol monophosphatase family protein [Ilumatobacter sp.]|nr:inositol monophosphatase family protein [Ilumatobacter sp.]
MTRTPAQSTADLQLALTMADAADAFTLPRFEQQDFTLGWKDDRTEVTEADRGAESLLATIVLAERPEHGFFGEEHGLQGAVDSPWRWIVDPIDGTSGFVRGIPVWATLIALTHPDHGVVTSVVSAPALQRRWWASAGDGSFANGRRCTVSKVAQVADAQVSITFSAGWDDLGLTANLAALASSARRSRGFGDFWQHCLVAEGALDVAVDAIGLGIYDIAAVRLIVEEAGGRFTDRHGVVTHESNSAISTNGHLHDQVLGTLNS